MSIEFTEDEINVLLPCLLYAAKGSHPAQAAVQDPETTASLLTKIEDAWKGIL